MKAVFLIIFSMVFSTSCELFNSESDKAPKLQAYFKPMEDLHFYDEWKSDIGRNLPLLGKHAADKLKIEGHSIQCDRLRCYDTFANTNKFMSFKNKDFKKVFKKKIITYILAQGTDTCGLEFLAFHNDIARTDYLKVLGVLHDLTCDVRVVIQKQEPLPEWPPMNKELQARFAKVVKTKDKAKQAKAGKWINSIYNKCKFLSLYKKNTLKKSMKNRRTFLFDSFRIPAQLQEIDSCKLPSADMMMALRVHAMGFDAQHPVLYSKPMSFVLGRGELTLSPKYRTWGDVVDGLLQSKSKEPTVQFIK